MNTRLALLVFLLTPLLRAEEAGSTDEVRVSGTRSVPGSTHVLSERSLKAMRYDDPHAVLTQVPGVVARGEDGVGLRPNIGMRGANSDRSKKVALMEDGVLFAPAPYSAPAAYYFPLAMRMRSVRVLKGPASIPYGPNTIGGAIDYTTYDAPYDSQGMVDVALGEYGYRKGALRVGAGDNTQGFLIDGAHLSSTGFKSVDFSPDADTGFARNEWMVKGRRALSSAHELVLKLGYSTEHSNETYLGLTDADFRKTPQRRYAASREDEMRSSRVAFALTHHARFSDRFELVTTLYRHEVDRTWRKVNGFRRADLSDVLRNPELPSYRSYAEMLRGNSRGSAPDDAVLIGPNQRQFSATGLQTQGRLRMQTGPLRHDMSYGLRLHHDTVKRLHTQDGFLIQEGALLPDGRVTEVTARNSASALALAMHASDAIAFRHLTITPGLRTELIHMRLDDGAASARNSQAVLLPGLGAYWEFARPVGLLVGMHKGFSPAPPGPAVPPEESWNYEGGLRLTSRRVRAEAIGFLSDYQNLTNLCTYSGGCPQVTRDAQTSAGRATIFGAELFGEGDVPVGRYKIPLRLAYTRTETELLTSFESADPQFGSVTRGDFLPYVPRDQLSVRTGFEARDFDLYLAANYTGPMLESAGRMDDSTKLKTDPALLFDLSGSVVLYKGVSLYANARNLFNETVLASRRPFGARPLAPRWVQAGLRVTF